MWRISHFCSWIAAAALIATHAAGQTEFDGSDPESIAKYLESLKPMSEDQVKKMVDGIASDDFATRQRAVNELAAVADQIRKPLEKIRDETEDPEIRKGLARVLSRPAKPVRSAGVYNVSRAVFGYGHRGLGAELAGAVAIATDRANVESVIAAARVSADEGDREGLVPLLVDTNNATRETAARALSGLGGDATLKSLQPLLADTSPMVRLAAVEAFAAAGDPACLTPLAELAAGNDFYVRWRASEMLRQITGGEIKTDPMAVPAPVELGKWKDVKGWKAPTAPAPIALLGGDRKISEWKEAPKILYDEVKIRHLPDGIIRSSGTGRCAWGSPIRFSNYRVRFDWRFLVANKHNNAGFSIGKFPEGLPKRFGGWESKHSLEVEIRPDATGNLYQKGFPLLKGGKPPTTENIDKLLPSNEDPNGWNSMLVEERDGRLRVYVNGLLQNDVTGISDELSSFGIRSEEFLIDFRNFTIEPLPGSVIAAEVTEEAPEK